MGYSALTRYSNRFVKEELGQKITDFDYSKFNNFRI